MFRALIFHLALMIAGYVSAVFIPAGILVFFTINMIAVFEFSNVIFVLHNVWAQVDNVFPVAVSMTAIFGFPGWLVAAFFSEFHNIRRKYWFAVAGAVNTLLAIAIGRNPLSRMGMLNDPAVIASLVCCGFIAGLAYWRIAGWRSGLWKGEHARAARTIELTGKYLAMAETALISVLRMYAGLAIGSLAAGAAFWLATFWICNGAPGVPSNLDIAKIVEITSDTGIYMFYPVVIIFLYAALTGRRSWQFHALGAIAVALAGFAFLFASGIVSARYENALTLPASFLFTALCGAINGSVYWLIAVPGVGTLLFKRLYPTSVSSIS
jgi:hypothetical protein